MQLRSLSDFYARTTTRTTAVTCLEACRVLRNLQRMSSTKVLWGQICAALGIVLVTMWTATQWVAWKLGFQPQLGPPWFELVGGNTHLLSTGLLLVVAGL